MTDPHAICAKWVKRIGLGFHPDTRGADYVPAMPADEIPPFTGARPGRPRAAA